MPGQLQWLTVGFKQTKSFFLGGQTYAVETLVHCAQSVWPLCFLSETKITFRGIIFVRTLQNTSSIRNRERWITCTLPELYRLFFKTQAYACFVGFIINFILTYFKIVCIYKLNFSFYKSRYRKRYSLDILSHLHLCFKNINFSKSTLSPKFYLNSRHSI